MTHTNSDFFNVFRTPRPWSAGMIAGLAGGAAEIVWIVLYMGWTGGDPERMPEGIVASVFPIAATTKVAIPLGILLHMAIAAVLGIVIVLAINMFCPQIRGTTHEKAFIIAVLIGVWAVNFFLILPVINPQFITLVPYGTSLISKVLFGFTAAVVLQRLPWRTI